MVPSDWSIFLIGLSKKRRHCYFYFLIVYVVVGVAAVVVIRGVAIIVLVVAATVAVQIHMLRDAVNAHADDTFKGLSQRNSAKCFHLLY